jgi:hypothetical protein
MYRSLPEPPTKMTPPLPPVAPALPPVRTGWLTLGLSLLGVALGAAALIAALIRPVSQPHQAVPAPAYTSEQVTAAKMKTCKAAKLAIGGLRETTSTALRAPSGPDDVLGWANVANARLADVAAALWLPTQVDAAAPQDLKTAVNELATPAGDALALSLAGTNQDRYESDVKAMNAAAVKIEKVCG